MKISRYSAKLALAAALVAVLSMIAPVSADAHPDTPELYATQLGCDSNTVVTVGIYRAVLNRNPEPAGFAYWVENPGGLADAALSGQESADNELSNWYLRVLGRRLDADGAAHWRSMPKRDALMGIVTSDEAAQKFSNEGCEILTLALPQEYVSEEHLSIEIPGTTNGSFQPSVEVRRAVWAAFGSYGVDVYVQALRVARCESGLDPAAHRTTSNRASMRGDRGLFQINYVHDKGLISSGQINQSSDLLNPYVNAQVAANLYASQGWQPWYSSARCH